MERSNSRSKNLQKFVAASLASAALLSCNEQSSASSRLTIVQAPKNNSYEQSLVVVETPDMESLEKQWDDALIDHKGEVDIAVYDFESGRTAHTHYPKGQDGTTFDTASIVKLSVLENLLLQSQTKRISIDSYRSSLAERMIEVSDNNATAVLWSELGNEQSMDKYWQHTIDTESTKAGTNGHWGNTQTTALDQLKVVNAIARAGTILSPLTAESGSYANNLLQDVAADQHWGVSGGVPADIPVNLKNGWFPDSFTTNAYSDTDSWTINSIGYIPHEYSIAVLTRGNPTKEQGIKTTEKLSAIAWQNLHDTTLAPNPPKP